MTYTYDDIITAKDILAGRVKKEDIIGKQGWFFDSFPPELSKKSLEDDANVLIVYGVLDNVSPNALYPFCEASDNWTYFLPEKVEEPRYIPFDLSDPKDRDALRGKWIRHKWTGNEWLISGFYKEKPLGDGWRVRISRKNAGFSARDLLDGCEFLDSSPVGKKEEV